MLQGFLSNIKSSNKSHLVKIFLLRDKLDNDDDEKIWQELRESLPKIESSTLSKIENELLQGASIESVLEGRFSYKYDPATVKQFTSIFSTSSTTKPSLTQQMIIIYQTISFICNLDASYSNENLKDLISAIKKGLAGQYATLFAYLYKYTIQTIINADKYTWDKPVAEAALETFFGSKLFGVESFDVFVSLVESILKRHDDQIVTEVVFTILINLISTQRNRIDNSSVQRLVYIIEKWVLNYNFLALRLLWVIASSHTVDTSVLMKSLSISIASPILKKAPKTNDPTITLKMDDVDNTPKTHYFTSSFDGKLSPIPFEFYYTDEIYVIFDEEIDMLNTVRESMSLADAATICEFYNYFDTTNEIVPFLILIWFLSKSQPSITNQFFDKIMNSYLFKMDESEFGPNLMNKFISQMRTNAIHLFAKDNYEKILQIINYETNSLVYTDILTRIMLIDPERLLKSIDEQLCEHLPFLYRLISNLQLHKPNDRYFLTARSCILYIIFELSKSGHPKLIQLLLEIAYENTLIPFSALAITNAYDQLSTDSLNQIGIFMDDNPEFGKALIHNLSAYLVTTNGSDRLGILVDHIVSILEKYCDFDIVNNVLDILNMTVHDFKLTPKQADILIRAIRCVNRSQIYNKVLTINTCESYIGTSLTLHRATFIILIFADNSQHTKDLLLKSTSETQNVVNMQEARIDSMLVSILDENGPIYGNYKLLIEIDDDFCLKLLSKILQTITSREVLSYALSVPKIQPTIENIVFNTAIFSQCPLFIGRTHQLTSKIDQNVLNDGFCILFWLHVDRNFIKASEAFEKYIIVIDDRITNKFSLMLRSEASRIFLTVESYNKYRTSRVDIAEFTRPLDSADLKWTLLALNVTNEQKASIDTLLASNDTIHERHTKQFDAIKMGPKPSITIGSTDLSNIAGLIGPVSLLGRKVNQTEFANFFFNPTTIPENCEFTTARFHTMIENYDGLTASKELTDFLKNNNFIDCLCSKKNVEFLITNRIYSIARFIFERSLIFTSDNFDIIKVLKGLPRNYNLYYNLFLLLSPHLRRGNNFKPLLYLLINPFYWNECLQQVTKHWATVLVTNINDSMCDEVFSHTISLLSSIFSQLDDICKQNIYTFIARLALHDITDKSAQALASIIFYSSGKRAKAFIYIARIIGAKLRDFKEVLSFELFDKFLQDNDNNHENIEIFGESILALSSIYGAGFHSFIPTLLNRFKECNNKENQELIYKYLMKHLPHEQNIALFMLCIDFDNIDEITKIVDPSNILLGNDWFIDVVHLAISSNPEKMNKLIIFISQLSNNVNDIRNIFYMMASHYSNSEIDPILIYANNVFAMQVSNNVAIYNELFFWCIATTFFHRLSDGGYSSALCKINHEFGFDFPTRSFNPDNIIFEVFNDGKNVSDRSKLDLAISIAEKLTKVDDMLLRITVHALKRNTAQEQVAFSNSRDFTEYNSSIEHLKELVETLYKKEKELIPTLNTFKLGKLSDSAVSNFNVFYTKSTDYANDYFQKFDN